jgi:CheY-like chemotaxis protein
MMALETMSVLVVDDMKSMRLTIRKMLRSLNIGKNLVFAENGKQALSILRQTPCDLAIIDWNMPVMNGSEMLTHLKKDKHFRDMPVIMVTAENERDVVTEVAENEIDAYLLKPLTLAALDQKIRQVVENVNNPDPATRYMITAREYEESGDLDKAIEQIRLALAHKPSASRILRKMGMLHFTLGKPGIAEKCLQKAIAVNRQDTASLVSLAAHYLEKKECKKAAALYLQILSLSDRYFDKAMDLGEELLLQGFTEEALEIFAKIVGRSGKGTQIKEDVIDICIAYEEFEFAKQLIADILRGNPYNSQMTFKAGMLHRDTRDLDTALAFFKTADSLEKGHIGAKMEIAKIHWRNNHILQADDYLNQILRLDPGNKDAQGMRRKL